MSIHFSLTPEARAKLRAQRLRSSLSSVVVAILTLVLVGLALRLVLLEVLRKESPVIVTYQGPRTDERILEQRKMERAQRRPSSPAASAAKIIVANVPDRTSVPVPESDVESLSIDFGTGDDFGDGWGGDGDGSGATGGVFGSSNGPGLAGSFYDLKQNPDGRPTEMTFQDFEQDGSFDTGAAVNETYDEHVGRAIRRNLEGSAFSGFFQAPEQLRLTQLYVPRLLAEEAPRAFHISDKVKGRRWVIAYRGTVTPPESGRFRFVGFSDDVLVVLVDNRVVLDGSLESPLDNADRRKFIHQTHTVEAWQTYLGKWMNVTSGRPVQLKVLIGERPGGHYSGYLLIEKVGLDYPIDANGSPILPLFKMAPSEMPKRGDTLPDLAPDTGWSVWPAEA